MENWQQHITIDPEIMLGKPCIKGTRITVELVLEKLGAGESAADLVEDYPHITHEDILACLTFASTSVRNEIVLPSAS